MAMDTMPLALDMAFRTAVLFTGATKSAEAAVIHGISAREELSPHGLLTEAVRSAVRRRTKSSDGPCEVECLPPELRRLFMLQPLPRHCFVLRVLVGLSPEVCAELLEVSVTEFENAVYRALTQLPLLCSPRAQPIRY
jgi:sigma-70-like protein